MKLLIIEDETDLLNLLAKGFRKKGYAVDTAKDGAEGLALYQINEYDLIILDLNLPSLDGLDILSEIRKENKQQRVLILSARSEIRDKVTGLDMGANDYLTKPFAFSELDARVRSLLRQEVLQHTNIIAIEKYSISLDTKAKQVSAGAEILALAPLEYRILEYLIMNADSVVSAEELVEHVWDSDVDPFINSVKVHISNIRGKLREACGSDVITTVRGHGYIIEKEDESK